MNTFLKSACILSLATLLSSANQPTVGDTTALIAEGKIVSVDITNNSIVLKVKEYKEDTLQFDKSLVIKAKRNHRSGKDFEQNDKVKVNYTMKGSHKIATALQSKPDTGFIADTVELGKNILIAEGTISSINKTNTSMTIRAPLEREYVFSLDPALEIRAGVKKLPIQELKPEASVKIQYLSQNGHNIAKRIEHKPLLLKMPDPLLK